jgi:hypothetical protein
MFYALFNLSQLTHYFTTKCFSKQLIHPRPIPTTYKRTIAAIYIYIRSNNKITHRLTISNLSRGCCTCGVKTNVSSITGDRREVDRARRAPRACQGGAHATEGLLRLSIGATKQQERRHHGRDAKGLRVDEQRAATTSV